MTLTSVAGKRLASNRKRASPARCSKMACALSCTYSWIQRSRRIMPKLGFQDGTLARLARAHVNKPRSVLKHHRKWEKKTYASSWKEIDIKGSWKEICCLSAPGICSIIQPKFIQIHKPPAAWSISSTSLSLSVPSLSLRRQSHSLQKSRWVLCPKELAKQATDLRGPGLVSSHTSFQFPSNVTNSMLDKPFLKQLQVQRKSAGGLSRHLSVCGGCAGENHRAKLRPFECNLIYVSLKSDTMGKCLAQQSSSFTWCFKTYHIYSYIITMLTQLTQLTHHMDNYGKSLAWNTTWIRS